MFGSGTLLKSLLTLLVLGGIGAIFFLPSDLQTLPGGASATRTAVLDNAGEEEVPADTTDSPAPALAEAAAVTADIRVTTARSLNMRAAPSTNGAVVASLPSGTRVSVTDTEGNWLFVQTESGQAGWISSRFAPPVSAQ